MNTKIMQKYVNPWLNLQQSNSLTESFRKWHLIMKRHTCCSMTGLFWRVSERWENFLAFQLGHSRRNKTSRVQLDFIELALAFVLSYKDIQWPQMLLWNFETEQFLMYWNSLKTFETALVIKYVTNVTILKNVSNVWNNYDY